MMRKSDSIPEKDVIIEDKALEPYLIVKSQTGGYAVYEKTFTEKAGKKNSYLRVVGYPSTFEYSLKVVADELVHSHSGKKKYSSIQDYLTEWKAVNNRLASALSLKI